MQCITVTNALLPSGWHYHQTLEIENGRIVNIRSATEREKALNVNGRLLPGYVDVQVNGGGGVLFNAKPSAAAIETMALAHLRFGTTSMLPTIITDNADTMTRAADAIAEVLAAGPEYIKTLIKGIHFEGPFLSTAKKGVHDDRFIRVPSDSEIATITRSDLGAVLVTIAPESVSSTFIEELVSEGVVVSIGHTNATFEQVQRAIDAGAKGFTHLYNAMSALTSREPGAVGAALSNAQTYSGFIIDHHHLHPKSAEIALKIKGEDRAMLVTDAMAHVGSDMSRLPFFNTEIIRSGNKLTTPEGTLAGSCLDMHSALVNTYSDCGISLESASKMASITPATFMNLQHEIGSIEVGKQADFVLLDNSQALLQVWSSGRKVL